MSIDDGAIDRREAFLHDLVHEAADLARAGFARQTGQAISMKGPQDYLTETDGQVEDIVRSLA